MQKNNFRRMKKLIASILCVFLSCSRCNPPETGVVLPEDSAKGIAESIPEEALIYESVDTILVGKQFFVKLGLRKSVEAGKREIAEILPSGLVVWEEAPIHYGLFNLEGEKLLDFDYTEIEATGFGSKVKLQEKKHWGLYDAQSRKMILSCRYEKIRGGNPDGEVYLSPKDQWAKLEYKRQTGRTMHKAIWIKFDSEGRLQWP